MSLIFAAYLEPFAESEVLQARVLRVLTALPVDVRDDFLGDPRFRMTIETHVPGRGWSVWMEAPLPVTTGGGSRCVVLRPRLAEFSESFACYVIAHELAHAFLRNGGWGAIDDREAAADALAASWGFVRPTGRY